MLASWSSLPADIQAEQLTALRARFEALLRQAGLLAAAAGAIGVAVGGPSLGSASLGELANRLRASQEEAARLSKDLAALSSSSGDLERRFQNERAAHADALETAKNMCERLEDELRKAKLEIRDVM